MFKILINYISYLSLLFVLFLNSCENELINLDDFKPKEAPSVTTSSISSVTTSSAVCGGNVTSDGGESVTSRGVCWSIFQNPTIDYVTHTNDGVGYGSYVSTITGLTSNTTYYVRAYATNRIGTSYGNQVSFTTLQNVGLPILTTTDISNITQNSAVSGGVITSDGGNSVISRGVCWGTTSNPTIVNSHTTDGTGIGSYVSSITGLTSGTTYYVRAYATNNVGTAYGNQINFTTTNANTVTDIDGNVYNTITIGTQIWLVENLKTTHYRNGDAIANVTDNTTWNNLTTGGYCDYNNNSNNVSTYGRLYNWYAVNDSRNIAPAGWHVATDNDWKILEIFLGMSQQAADSTMVWRGTDQGNKLKEAGNTHWLSPSAGTNSSGFSAFPGGYRFNSGSFTNMGSNGLWWTSTVYNTTFAWYRDISYNKPNVYRSYHYKNFGFNVRCVKD